ncbi:pilus assembly protein PilM [Caldicellulosiruptoraceae bacterium PP1]
MSQVVSIELGRSIIKVCQGSYSNKKLFISKYSEHNLEDPIFIDDIRVDKKLLIDVMEKFYFSNNFNRRGINIIISGLPNMLIRELVIPDLPKEKTHSLIQFESRQYFPVNMDNYLIDYKQITKFIDNKQKKQKILLVAVPKSIIEGIIEAFSDLNLKINKIDIEANSLTKLVYHEREIRKEEKNSLYLIVNLMRYFITTVIAEDQNIIIAKTFPNYDLERMFKEGNDYGLSIENMFMYVINEIVENIVKFYEFYKSREQNPKDISKIYLTGEVCQHFDISSMLNSKINTQIELLTDIQLIENRVILNKSDLFSYSICFSGIL